MRANLLLSFYLSCNSQANYKGLHFSGYMSLKDPMTQEYISSEKLSWNASGIILGIGTLQVSLTLHNRLNNERKKIKRDYSLCKIIIVRPSNNYYLHLSIVTEIK